MATSDKNSALIFEEPVSDPLSLAEYIADNRYFKNKYYDELEECYKVVEEFIKRNNRVLVGGMAIDFALKDRGSFLYKKSKIDYDFLSPEFHRDAYKLGEILTEKFGNISVIGALHASTMRVRYKFMPVADITYMPLNFYEKLETINYMGFRCIHPHLQMIDQMRSIVYMAENPPRESFFGDRIVKDIKRFCMLAKLYPIVADTKESTKKSSIKKYKIPIKWLAGNCLSGMAAGAYWFDKLSVRSKLSFERPGKDKSKDDRKNGKDDKSKDDKSKDDKSKDDKSKDDNASIAVSIPEDEHIVIYSDKPEDLVKLISDELQSDSVVIKKYKAILDKLPERTVITSNNSEIYEIVDSSTSLVLADKVDDFHVICLYGVMMYLLISNAYIDKPAMLPDFFDVIFKDFSNNVPAMPADVVFYGTNNWSEPYLLSLKKGTPGFKPMLPSNAYPEKNKPVPIDAYSFDPTKSDILQKDGFLE